MQVVLVMFKSDGSRRDFPIADGSTIVGRKHNCDLRIPLTSVSRQHCELVLKGEQLTVRDLGSSNGTFHNGVRVQQAKLKAADELAVGPVTFTVVVDGRPAKIKPVKSIVTGRTKPAASSADEPVVQQPRELSDPKRSAPEPLEDDEHLSPTVDLDDPIAALEAMADADDDGKSSLKGLNDFGSDDSIMDLLRDDDDDDDLFFESPAKPSK
jgi:predicted component of type VI protein secretion system